MCLAIMKPAGLDVPDEYLARAAARHPHGFGMGWVYPGSQQLHLWRSVTDSKAWRRKAASLKDAKVVMHARYATHGPKVKANCHPSWLGDPGKSLVAHNGVLRSLPDCKAGRSDSRVFIDHVLDHFADGWQQDRVLVSQLESLIGTGNKVLVLNADATHLILNERLGMWHEGVWYSNDSWKPVEKFDMGWGDAETTGYRGHATTRSRWRWNEDRKLLESTTTDCADECSGVMGLDVDEDDDLPAFPWWDITGEKNEHLATCCERCAGHLVSQYEHDGCNMLPADMSAEEAYAWSCEYCYITGEELYDELDLPAPTTTSAQLSLLTTTTEA